MYTRGSKKPRRSSKQTVAAAIPLTGVFFYVRFPEGDRRFNPWIAPRYGATPSGALFGHHGDVGGSACRMMHQVGQADDPPQ
jgi:hypothetical protein